MKTLDGLNKAVVDLNGVPLKSAKDEELTVKSLISNALARGQSKEPARSMMIAIQIYGAKGKVELEDSDFALAKKAVEDDPLLNNMAKAAALVPFNEDKQEK